jgi:DNA-binding SARP family transcriptional activator/tetratricopeptide (TPR) repeat protein
MAVMTSLAVRVLGDFTVDGLDRRGLGSRKARQLLHLLALARGRVVPTDVLIEALWPDTPPIRPEDQLSVLVSRLRSTLGRDRIEHRDGGYLLRCDWLDATELTALADEVDRRRDVGNMMGAAAAARVVLSFTRGTEPGQAPGEWARSRHAELERLVGRARRAAATALLEAGDWPAAVEAAAVALQHDPYDETALRVLLRGYVMGGQVAAALAVYAAARQRLADELGCDPAPETAAVHMAILRGELLVGGTAVAASTARIIERDDELTYLDALAARVRAGSTEVVILDGEAGIGKTTLLRAWCATRELAGDCVLVASCGPLDRAMPLDALLTALRELLRRLGSPASADLLGADATLLGPLIGDAQGQVVPLADSMLGPAVLYAALSRVFRRLIGRAPLVVAVDDAHLAGQALRDLLGFLVREQLPAMIVAAVRTGEGEPLAGTAGVHLDALSKQAVAELAGAEHADELYARSLGHPLFLTELIQQAPGAELPASLIESVCARCDGLGTAGALLRTAAVIGSELNVDLLAALLGRGAVDVLDDAERAIAAQLLVADNGAIRFRHELVREALAASATAGRVTVLHRQAGRVLAARGDADPARVAEHARLGGDQALASDALAEAAARAAERFDHAAAEALLDDALAQRPAPGIWLDRARVRTRRARYDDALRDVERAAAAGAGPAALEVGAWASYFDRRFTDAAHFADDGALASGDVRTRARCLAVGGRIRHAAGDLPGAERQLAEALSLANGADRVTAAAWLGVLRTHQSRADEALALLRPASRGQIGAEHTSATLHALLFLGHAHAVAGYPALALDSFAQYTAEVRRRQVPRFAGRAVNFAGWVLRNLGAAEEGYEHHREALETGRGQGTSEVTIAALEDLAEHCLDGGDADGARSYLSQAGQLLAGDLVFGWRLRLKLDLLTGRLALLRDDAELAMTRAVDLEARASALGVPRYVSVARLLRHRARHRLGVAVDLPEVAADLDLLDASMAVEAWWWTGDLAADCACQAWLTWAGDRASRLVRNAGRYADQLTTAVDRRMEAWSKAVKDSAG